VKVGKDPKNRGHGETGPYTFKEVTVTSTSRPDQLQVCVDPQLGEQCIHRTALLQAVKCFASSATSIGVEWEAAASEGDSGLLTEYRVTAFSLDEQMVATVNSTARTRATFALGATTAGSPQLKHNLVYNVQVEALYDKGTIKSKAVTCQIPQAGLPCIPPPPADPSTTNTGEDVGTGGGWSSKGGASNCPCLQSHKIFDRLKIGTRSEGKVYIQCVHV